MSEQRVSVMLGTPVEASPWRLLEELGRRGWRIAITYGDSPRGWWPRMLRRRPEQLTQITAERVLDGAGRVHLVSAGPSGDLGPLAAELAAMARGWEREYPDR